MTQTGKARATTTNIIDAATTLFFKHGYERTTISMVADEAGVAQGTVILRVGSKSELAVAAFSHQISQVVAEAASASPGTSVIDDLSTFATSLYSWYDDHQLAAPAMLREALFCSGQWAEEYQQTVADTVVLFNQILARHNHLGSRSDGQPSALFGEGILADYLLVLMYGIRRSIPEVAGQVAHFIALTQTRLGNETGRQPKMP